MTNTERVIAAWKAFASRDPAQIAACFAEDAEWIAPKGNATALALELTDHMKGPQQIGQFIGTELRRLFGEIKIDFKGIHAAGDIVIVEERMTAVLADGRPYENDYCFIFELQDGLIRRVREYMDTAKGHRMIFGG
ncbi:MAG TPA: nuclear transport factor 2 family protein [Ferrovibrio sp.]|jgi:ketosteroid isomerase-like protein|uniref:nuclear transport factor 2 family protein n=1 Tax=Ferrovibrio sp. TaxID=1917215 RepID=UPI002ED62083